MSLKVNAIKNVYANLVYFFFQFLSSILVFRISGAAEAGVYSLAISYVSVFYIVSSFGLNAYILSDVEKVYTEQEYFGANIVAITVVLVVSLIVLPFMGFRLYIMVSSSMLMLYKSIEAFTCFLNANMQFKKMYSFVAVSATLRGVFPIVALCLGLFVNLPVAIIFMFVAYVIVTLVYDIRRASVALCPNFNKVKQILMSCMPLMLVGLSVPIINFITRYIIQAHYSEEVLGYFSSVYSLNIIVTLLAGAVWSSYTPIIASEYAMKLKGTIWKRTFFAMGGSAIFMALVFIGCRIAGRFILSIVFGEKIVDYTYLLIPTMIVSGVLLISGYFSTLLNAFAKRNQILISGIVATIASCVSIVPFITFWGLIGAIWAALLGAVVQTILYAVFAFYYLRKG